MELFSLRRKEGITVNSLFQKRHNCIMCNFYEHINHTTHFERGLTLQCLLCPVILGHRYQQPN